MCQRCLVSHHEKEKLKFVNASPNWHALAKENPLICYARQRQVSNPTQSSFAKYDEEWKSMLKEKHRSSKFCIIRRLCVTENVCPCVSWHRLQVRVTASTEKITTTTTTKKELTILTSFLSSQAKVVHHIQTPYQSLPLVRAWRRWAGSCFAPLLLSATYSWRSWDSRGGSQAILSFRSGLGLHHHMIQLK